MRDSAAESSAVVQRAVGVVLLACSLGNSVREVPGEQHHTVLRDRSAALEHSVSELPGKRPAVLRQFAGAVVFSVREFAAVQHRAVLKVQYPASAVLPFGIIPGIFVPAVFPVFLAEFLIFTVFQPAFEPELIKLFSVVYPDSAGITAQRGVIPAEVPDPPPAGKQRMKQEYVHQRDCHEQHRNKKHQRLCNVYAAPVEVILALFGFALRDLRELFHSARYRRRDPSGAEHVIYLAVNHPERAK